MKILIYEPDRSGHVLNFVRLLVEGFAMVPGCEILVATTRQARESSEYATFLAPLESRFELVCIERDAESPRGSFAFFGQRLDCLQGLVRRLKPERVYIPHADGISQVMGVRCLKSLGKWELGAPVEGLQLRASYAYPSKGMRRKLQHQLSRVLIRLGAWDKLFFLDPWVFSDASACGGRLAVMPDPVEKMELVLPERARELLGIDSQGVFVGTVGGLDCRKGVDLLVKAFAKIPRDMQVKLLLAGKVRDEIATLVYQDCSELLEEGRLVLLDRWMSDEDFRLALCACDVVATPYPSHIGSASIVLRAAAAGKPVIGSDFGWIGKTIKVFSLGVTCDVQDLDVFSRCLAEIVGKGRPLAPDPRVVDLLNYCSPENFQKTWRRELGLLTGRSESVVEWESVRG